MAKNGRFITVQADWNGVRTQLVVMLHAALKTRFLSTGGGGNGLRPNWPPLENPCRPHRRPLGRQTGWAEVRVQREGTHRSWHTCYNEIPGPRDWMCNTTSMATGFALWAVRRHVRRIVQQLHIGR